MTSDRPDRLTRSSLATLAAWRPPSPEQDRLRHRYEEHLRTRDEGWSRDCVGAHLTASSLICAPAARSVLLVLHRKLGRWLQTGGHIEAGDDDLAAAALREAREESGIADLVLDRDPLLLSRHEVPCGPIRPTFHLDVQYGIWTDGLPDPIRSEESEDVRWFGVDDLPPVDASVRELVAAASRRLGWT